MESARARLHLHDGLRLALGLADALLAHRVRPQDGGSPFSPSATRMALRFSPSARRMALAALALGAHLLFHGFLNIARAE